MITQDHSKPCETEGPTPAQQHSLCTSTPSFEAVLKTQVQALSSPPNKVSHFLISRAEWKTPQAKAPTPALPLSTLSCFVLFVGNLKAPEHTSAPAPETLRDGSSDYTAPHGPHQGRCFT